MTNGFTRRREQSKEEIRKAAWELFNQFGVEKVSMVDIARMAEVSQATIYNNFGSKETLVHEYMTAVVDQLLNRVQEVLSHNQPYWEKMTSFFQLISTMMVEGKPAAGAVVGFNNRLGIFNDPEIKKVRDAAQERMTTFLLGLIREGKAQGQIQANLSEEAYRVYFIAFMDLFVGPQFQQSYYQNPGIVQDLGALMLYGLGGRPE